MAHVHDKIDFTTSAYIVHPDLNKVLLVFHKKFNGWLQIGGHVELDENTDQALLREIKEECGLEVEFVGTAPGKAGKDGSIPLHKPDFLNIHETYTKKHYHLDLRFVMIAKTTELNPEPGESTQLRWFTRHDLYSPEFKLADHDRWYFLEAIKLAKAHRAKS